MARLAAWQDQETPKQDGGADNRTVIAGCRQLAAASGRPLSVVVECDTGRKRAGVETPGEGAFALDARSRVKGDAVRRLSCCNRPQDRMERKRKNYSEELAGVSVRWARAAIGINRRLAEPEKYRQAQGRDEHRPGTYI